MGVQNGYNNYIKRQKQSSTGQFRQKVMNSLSGKAVGNNTAINPSTSIGQPTNVNTLGVTPTPTSANKNINKPIARNVVQPSTIQPKPYDMNEHIFNPSTPQNPLQSNILPQTSTPTPIQPNDIETPQITPPIENNQVPGVNTGMMSLSDINKNIQSPTPQDQEQDMVNNQINTFTPQDIQMVNQLAMSPKVQAIARASKKPSSSKKPSKPKTPQQIAQQLVTDSKKQLQKEWETKQKQFDEKNKQLETSFNQSKKDAETSYKDSEGKLQDSRYQQQEDLAVSGQRRGIQYSPQQLALENVANINYNKNLSELSTKRNELLNKLTIELNKSKSDILMSRQDATTSYNSSVANLMADYNKQLMDWAYNDKQTADDRKWQEKQTKADRDFQKKMQEAQNKWQGAQNDKDRKKGRSGSYGSGFSYSPRSYSSNFKPYSGSAFKNFGRYSVGGNGGLDLSNDLDSNVLTKTAKEYMTDMYNAIDYGGMNELDNKGRAYNSVYKNITNQIGRSGNSKNIRNELGKTYDTGIKHIYNKSYARSTNTPYLQRGTKITPSTPLRTKYIKKKKSTQQLDKANYYSKYARTKKQRYQAKVNSNFFKSSGQGRTISDLKKFNSSQRKSAPKKSTPRKTYKRPSFQQKISNSWNNLKRNVKKLFRW